MSVRMLGFVRVSLALSCLVIALAEPRASLAALGGMAQVRLDLGHDVVRVTIPL